VRCPACSSEVEEGADLCLECGEPLGSGPAATVAKRDAGAPSTEPRPLAPPAARQPTMPERRSPPPVRTTLPGTLRARQRFEEPDLVRCPSCGAPTRTPRCPGCGTRIRPDDE
jgi:hypothetical protein